MHAFPSPAFARHPLRLPLLLVLVATLLPLGGCHYLNPAAYARFGEVMQQHAANEAKALEILKEIAQGPLEKDKQYYLDQLEYEGADLWQQNLRLLASLPKLPGPLQDQARLLTRYNRLRLETYNLMRGRIKHTNTVLSPDIQFKLDSTEYILQEIQGVPVAERIVIDPAKYAQSPLRVSEGPFAEPDFFPGSGDPLVIVDGTKVVPDANGEAPAWLQDFNPDDISSMTVLKDQESLAEYGEEGKNGVVLITLKKGKKRVRP